MRLAVLLSLTLLFTTHSAFAQWQPIESPSGAQIRDVVESGPRIFASTYSGLYYSDDNGTQWTNAFSGPYERGFVSKLIAVGSVVICRIRSLETGDYHIFLSENNGEDWRDFPEPGPGSVYRNMHYNGETLIYQVAGTVIFVSSDLGENWEIENSTTLPFSPNHLRTAGEWFFMIDNDYNLWRADSAFENWTMMPLELEFGEVPQFYVDGDLVLAGFSNRGVLYSTNGGADWETSSSFTTWSSHNEGFWPDGDQIYTIHWGDVYTSEDQGVTWTQLSPVNSDFTDLIFLDDEVLLAEQESMYLSPDFGQTLEPVVEGLQGLTVENFKLGHDQLLYYSDRGLRLADIGADEISVTETAVSNLSLDEMVSGGGYYYVNESTISSGPYNHEIFRITPDGTTTFVYGSDQGSWLYNDHLKYTDDKLIYFNNGPAQYSTDNGDTWQNLLDLTDGNEYVYNYERHGDAVFTVGVENVKRLRDGESNWELVTDGLDLETFPIGTNGRSIRLLSTPGALFLVFARNSSDFLEFFVSHDDGDSWQATATDWPEIIAPYLNSPQGVKNIVALGGFHVMALRDVGVVVSADQGLNWTVYNEGLPTEDITQLDVYDDRLIAGTRRHGFWELGEGGIQLQTIVGEVFFDENTDGQLNAGEPLLPNVKLVLDDESDLAFTNEEGQYQLSFVNDGDYSPVLDNPYLRSEPGQRNTSDSGPLDFAIQLEESLTDFCVSLHADRVHRPGFPMRYYLEYRNLAEAVSSASLVLTYYDLLQFENATLTPSSHVGNQLSFELGTLPPLASGIIAVDFTLDVSAPLGGDVLSTLAAEIPVADANIGNNTFNLEDIVVGAYDPNDIQVNLTRINPGQVSDEIELEYRIRFQNTGNYPADRVVVRNKIADGLRMSSIRRVITSHPVTVERSADQELSFVFDDIQLADSTSNEAASHGFITYRIKVNPTLALGDTIPNQAAIYFDFNAPIITNIATTTVEEFVRTRNINAPDIALKIWPNPIKGGMPIQLGSDHAEPGTLFVFDALGRSVRTIEQFDPAHEQLSTVGLRPGQYYLVLETDRRWLRGRVIVQ